MECQEAVEQTRLQVANIPKSTKRIVVPVGSGMSLCGILHGLQDVGLGHVPVLGIVVGASPIKRLTKYAPIFWQAPGHTSKCRLALRYPSTYYNARGPSARPHL